MRVTLAYISLVLLWSTTPLAIQWSSRDVGFLFGAAARMVIGLAGVLLVLLIIRKPISVSRKALQTYLGVALQFYSSMIIVCWAAQFIPSGWVSVVFGLVPLMTAVIAAIFLKERSLTFIKLISYLMGLGGLSLMFGSALQLGTNAVLAVSGLVLAAFFQVTSAVWVKQINAQLPALVQVAGGLLLAVPAYLLTWWCADGHWPRYISTLTWGAINYLGILATTFGFALYYYILKHLSATRVGLISLMSPVLALLLGHYLNHEPLTLKVILGVSMILGGLVLHEWGDRRVKNQLAQRQWNIT